VEEEEVEVDVEEDVEVVVDWFSDCSVLEVAGSVVEEDIDDADELNELLKESCCTAACVGCMPVRP
jgi:hypothetical protein